jgi:hypothetical protein
MLQCISGVRYDAVERCLYIQPQIEGDFRIFLCTEQGYGTTGVQNGKPFVEVKSGTIDIDNINFTPYSD